MNDPYTLKATLDSLQKSLLKRREVRLQKEQQLPSLEFFRPETRRHSKPINVTEIKQSQALIKISDEDAPCLPKPKPRRKLLFKSPPQKLILRKVTVA